MAQERSQTGMKTNLAAATAALSTMTPPTMAPATAGGQQGRPTGVTILGVLDFIGGAALAILGLAMFAGGAFLGSLMTSTGSEEGGALGGIFAALFGILGFVFIGLSALYITLGVGTMGGKPWAWTGTIVLQWIGIVMGLIQVLAGDITSLVGMAIGALILWYYYEPGPKAWFGKSDKTAPWARFMGK